EERLGEEMMGDGSIDVAINSTSTMDLSVAVERRRKSGTSSMTLPVTTSGGVKDDDLRQQLLVV
ncbi:Hypothetical predicted protein, partial [Olea europaea subsp. europaea]